MFNLNIILSLIKIKDSSKLNKTKKKNIKKFLFQKINISLKRKLIIISNLLDIHVYN